MNNNLETEKGATFVPFYEVFVVNEGMRADIVFHKPPEGCEAMSFSDVVNEVKKNGVRYGIREDIIQKVLILGLFERKVAFAFGKEAENGEDGSYEFFFRTEFDKKPSIREDGVAKYFDFESFARVSEGQKLVVYHPAKKASEGYDVYGNVKEAVDGMELPKMPGKGFHILEDGVTYVSNYHGKVELSNGELCVTSIHEIMGDVSVATGNVEFEGDVLIHGKVRTGMSVKASGSITVEDVLEAATLTAGEDVVLKEGALGNDTGHISAGRDVYGKFFDKILIEAEGSIYCDYSIGSRLFSKKSVVAAGAKGSILGGETYGFESIEGMNFGNEKFVRTILNAGLTNDDLMHYYENEHAVSFLEEEMQNTKRQMTKRKLSNEAGNQLLEDLDKKKRECEKELNQLSALMERAMHSKIIGHQNIYPGTIMKISGQVYDITSEKKAKLFFLEDQMMKEQSIKQDM